LKIDFIDESVDLTSSPDANDYIGSARIPLKRLLTEEAFLGDVPIMNEKNIQNGQVNVQISCYKSNLKPQYGGENQGMGTTLEMQGISRNVLKKIAEALAG